MDTLFGHLVTRFGSTQAENLATEGLNYVLGRSTEARRLFLRLLEQTGRLFPGDVSFSTQAADAGGAIPDLVGRDAAGVEAVIVEAKFWAGLTGRQPVAYLARLPVGGLLVFVAPVLRFEGLWPELTARCRNAGHAVEEVAGCGSDWRVAILADGRRLALTSWRAVLDGLQGGLHQAGEAMVAADVLQLRGLADRMDADAFLPIASEELTAATGRRIIQFCQLVDDAVARLRSQGVADTSDGRSSSDRNGSYWRPFRIGPFGCNLVFDTVGWAARGVPLTLRIGDRNWKPSQEVCDALAPLGNGDPRRLIIHDRFAYLPIRPRLGVERDQVLDGIVAQIMPVARIAAACAARPVGPTATPTSPAVGPGPDLVEE
ncbi:MAG: hypothetical protein JWO38_4401 [Gemmataceae bacterium]|nr:hypothetical protein [Gemmataceae bacterium]